MKKSLKFVLSILLLIGVGAYFYLFQGHRNIADEKPTFSLTLTDLDKEFSVNESLATKKYSDKTISIYGKLTSLDLKSNGIILDDKIYATFIALNNKNLKLGSMITIKGRFLGFDELLGEFKLDQISVVE